MQSAMSFEIFNNVFPGIFGFIYLYILTMGQPFPKFKKRLLFFMSSVLFVAAATSITYYVKDAALYKPYVAVLGLVSGLCLSLFITGYKDGRGVLIFWMSISINLVGSIMGEIVGSASVIARIITKVIVYIIILILIYRYFRKPAICVMEEMDRGWHRLALIPFLDCVLCFMLVASGEVYHNFIYKMIALTLVFLIIATYVSLYHMFCVLQEQYHTKANYSLMDTQIESLKKQIETAKGANDQLALFRHDIRHFMAIQMSALEEGDMDSAKQVLISMEHTLEDISEKMEQYTDSPFLNAVITNYAEKSKKNNIDFKVQTVMPDYTKVDYLELAVVISNALENAWNACMMMGEGSEKFISLNGTDHYGQYLLEIVNTYNGSIQFNKEYAAPVSDKEEHGYGTRSIIAFAEKYHAYLEFKTEGRLFKMRLIL